MKTAMRVLLAVLFLAAMAPVARAQQNPDAINFFAGLSDCAESLGGWKCLELDLTTEASAENDSTKVYEYSWNFGDGNRMPGARIEHCYDQFGSYQVTMDLIDTETNTVIRNELSATVYLYPEIFPAIATRTENLPPSFMEFTCRYNDADQFEPDRVYWRIDGAYYEGRSIVHAFPAAGVFLIEMAVEKDMGFLGTVTAACTHTEITIKQSDVWTAQITDFIRNLQKKAGTGPFASGDVMCHIRSGPDVSNGVTIPLATLMSEIALKEDQTYEIMLFSGNLFSPKKKLDTHGIRGNDLYSALKDTVSSFLHTPFTFFQPVKFEMNQSLTNADDGSLIQTAALLRQHPYLSVEVGSYIHTGSRITRGLRTALARASATKDALIRNGISPERILVASPEYNRALVNTCSALPDCDWENPDLNGKVEFKIVGTNL
jgi:hypothetical protein